ncbi:MAG: hypothetical protein ACFFDT_28280 [Candidatus Hodarchaeota archaeon]
MVTYWKLEKKMIESKNPTVEWDEFLAPLIRTIKELEKQLNIQDGDLTLKK